MKCLCLSPLLTLTPLLGRGSRGILYEVLHTRLPLRAPKNEATVSLVPLQLQLLCTMVSSPSWAVVRPAAVEVLTGTVTEETTLRQFMGKLAEALSVTREELKKHKSSLLELIAQNTAEEEDSSDDNEDNQDQDEGDQDGRSSHVGNKENAEKDSKGMMAMRAMAKAMNLHRYVSISCVCMHVQSRYHTRRPG